ncbi:hypothetical protein NS228_17675 [Methylobacterium indicum]|jgi:hypothetical protein|uniref:hypothetical protein n=2 Tax=Methylobacteriaceae TaxID=119045 RepID=UPI000733EBD3|nr:hypothetical protein [Methylobacterium indicum]KTS25013.1 hypothetical protein NS229_20760 [Methylobacterium indicum]KTS38312.1 hypothetical protein NS228_17675 [Methylobacterium indicum]KTS44829.1 hypothetical protein NS230_24785 [Methylobacterium indicum]SFF87293.1 hypothetical protein SAMN04487844_1643 [Methylobacterium sp. yr596]
MTMRGPTMIDAVMTHAKTAAAAIGIAGSLVGAYVATGLPIPATQSFVRAEVTTVAVKIDALALAQLELQRAAIFHTRARLRAEQAVDRALRSKVDATSRVALDHRTAEIGDELARLEREDEELRLRIAKLRGG